MSTIDDIVNSDTDSESPTGADGVGDGEISDGLSVGDTNIDIDIDIDSDSDRDRDRDSDSDDIVSDDEVDYDGEDDEDSNDVSSMSDRLKAHDIEGRKTSMFMTSYELTRIIGIRAIMIRDGAPPAIDIGDMDDPFDIAYAELAEGKCPLNIKRPVPFAGGIKEDTISANQLINVNQRV